MIVSGDAKRNLLEVSWQPPTNLPQLCVKAIEMDIVRARGQTRSICVSCGGSFLTVRKDGSNRCAECFTNHREEENRQAIIRLSGVGDFKVLAVGFHRYGTYKRIDKTYLQVNLKCLACGKESERALHRLASAPIECSSTPCDRRRLAQYAHSQIDHLQELLAIEISQVDPPTLTSWMYAKVNFRCRSCNREGRLPVNKLMSGKGCGCENQSQGHALIRRYLQSKNYKFLMEHSLRRLGAGRSLRYDFYIPDTRVAIEYDGPQHFKPVEFFGGADGFAIRQSNDAEKNEASRMLGITLIRVRYDTTDIIKFLSDSGI